MANTWQGNFPFQDLGIDGLEPPVLTDEEKQRLMQADRNNAVKQ
jgi:hypothetical protein